MSRDVWSPTYFKKGELIATGRNRAVYAHGRFVVKVPLNDHGYGDNDLEAHYSRRYGRRPDPDGIVYARCGWLVMERVNTRWVPREERPDWADWIDCGQVGRTKDGRFVAYDFGR